MASLLLTHPGVGNAEVEKPLALFYISVQEALASNNQIKQSMARLASALTLHAQAKSVVLPTLSLDWKSSYTSTKYRNGRTTYDPTSLTLSASQLLFDLAAIREIKRVDPQIKAYELDLEAVRQQVYFSLIQASIALLETREVTRLAKNNLDVTKHHLEATQARFSVGEVTKTDVSQATSRVAIAKADWIRQTGEGLVSEAMFFEIAGIPFPDKLQVPLVMSKLPDQSLAKLLPLVKDRHDIMAAKYRLQAEQEQIQVEKAGHYPTLSLSSSGARTWDPSSSSVVGPSDAFSISVTASLPIYSGGLTTAQTRQAKSDRDLKQADLDLLLEKAVRELKQVLARYRSAKATDEALKTAVSAALEAKDGVDQEHQVGSRTSLDLLDAQNELFSAQTEQVKSQFAVNLTLFELLKVLGRLTPEGEGFDLVLESDDVLPRPMAHEEAASPQVLDLEDTVSPVALPPKQRWAVQIAALHDENVALKTRDDLNKKGADLFIKRRIDKDGKTLYLVRFGRYGDAEQARKAQREFSEKFGRDAFIAKSIAANIP